MSSKMIKSQYPEKVVIAYTAGSPISNLVIQAKEAADDYIKKDASIEEWRDILDNTIKSLSNPIEVWRKARIRLLDARIELNDLIKIEQAFLANIDNGKEATKSAIKNQITSNPSNSQWAGEIAGFLASKAFDLAFDQLKNVITAQ